MDTSTLTHLQQRIAEAQNKASRSKGYPQDLVFSIVHFIQSSPRQTWIQWSELLSISTTTLSRWCAADNSLEASSQVLKSEPAIDKSFEFFELSPQQRQVNADNANHEVTISIGTYATAKLKIDQLAQLLQLSK